MINTEKLFQRLQSKRHVNFGFFGNFLFHRSGNIYFIIRQNDVEISGCVGDCPAFGRQFGGCRNVFCDPVQSQFSRNFDGVSENCERSQNRRDACFAAFEIVFLFLSSKEFQDC